MTALVREKKIYSLADELTTAHSYAVLGSAEKFRQHKHAWKVWRALKQFGCTVYPVAQELSRLDGSKVYPQLAMLTGKIEVVVPCLLPQLIPALVEEAAEAGAKYIWFQEQTWTEDFDKQCEQAGIVPVKGCVLRHKVYKKPWGYFHPCFWHGLRAEKAPSRRF